MTDMMLLEAAFTVDRHAGLFQGAVVIGLVLAAIGLARIGWHHLGRYRAASHKPDDLMALADDVFREDARPVNEARKSRWASVNSSPNRGAFFDAASRASTQQNGRWITGRMQEAPGVWITEGQQELAGAVLAAQTETFLQSPEAEREARLQAAVDEGWQRGEPGE